MTIQEAIKRLTELGKIHSFETEIITDCQYCGRETKPDHIVAVPAKVRLEK